MKGIPYSLNTRSDYINAFRYALKHCEYREDVLIRFENLKKSTFFMDLKKDSFSKKAEKQMQEDYEEREDVNSLFKRINLDASEIDKMVEELRNAKNP